MPIRRDEIIARILPDNVEMVEQNIGKYEKASHKVNYWAVAIEATGELVACRCLPKHVTELDILDNLKERELYEDMDSYVIYQIDPDEYAVMEEEMIERPDRNTNAYDVDSRFAQRVFKGRRKPSRPGQPEPIVERLNWTPPEPKTVDVDGLRSTLETEPGMEVRIQFSGDIVNHTGKEVIKIHAYDMVIKDGVTRDLARRQVYRDVADDPTITIDITTRVKKEVLTVEIEGAKFSVPRLILSTVEPQAKVRKHAKLSQWRAKRRSRFG